MSILVLGATGLLGNAVFRVLSESGDCPVFGTIRNVEAQQFFIPELASRLQVVEDLRDEAQMITLFDLLRPNVVVNCTALGKDTPQDPMKMVSVFSVLPRRLAHLCRLRQVRLVQISSDGVFSGNRGGYTEDDLPDANDPYGIAKLLGEVEGPGMITLRTSIIGHELFSRNGLLEWFLSQDGECTGYRRVIFSGFPTVALAQVIRDVVLPCPELQGIYHLATSPISKFDLLQLVAQRYSRSTRIVPSDKLVIDRSLSADRFARATGYVAPEWPELIDVMYSYKFGLKES
ncbi:MAG: SDR family oxidoreductase [Caedimonas sp.]|jgi:dTDP-4-dehydrorhamnose reductase|nr:SDR family oxidoreductase [Caedimonas sp.]